MFDRPDPLRLTRGSWASLSLERALARARYQGLKFAANAVTRQPRTRDLLELRDPRWPAQPNAAAGRFARVEY